jgi:hypothetical protein
VTTARRTTHETSLDNKVRIVSNVAEDTHSTGLDIRGPDIDQSGNDREWRLSGGGLPSGRSCLH